MSVDVFHDAAGLIVCADRRIPGLPLATRRAAADIRVHPGRTPAWRGSPATPLYTSPYASTRGVPLMTAQQGQHGFRFSYADGTDIWIAASGREVWCAWEPPATLEDTATYLAGPVIGFVLRLRGRLALHASAVCMGAGAVALVGRHGAGKSTIAAALAKRGHPVVTDDVLHLSQAGSGWVAHPFAEHLRLWPDGAMLALGGDADLPRLTPTWDKRRLEVGTRGIRGTPGPVPLIATLLLDAGNPTADQPHLQSVSRAEAFVQLAANSSCSHLLTPGMRAREFDALSDVVRSVPCARAASSGRPGSFDCFLDLVERCSLERHGLQHA